MHPSASDADTTLGQVFFEHPVPDTVANISIKSANITNPFFISSFPCSKFFSRWHHNVLSLPKTKANDMIVMKEKHISTTALSILTSSILGISCSQQMDAFTAIPDSVRTAIDSTREVMLATVDTTQLFWFSNDVEFQSADPHAYWLMNRMMHTVQNVRTAEDGIAWALALNENVQEYSRRIDRRIYEIKAEDAAVRAIKDLVDIYAASGIMTFHTYAAAGYSALPMDINLTFAYWSEQRHKELMTERDTFWKYHWEPFKSDCKRVSSKRFLKLIRYYTILTLDRIVKENAKDWNLKRSEYVFERLNGCFDFDRISEMAHLYEEAYCNWLEAREEIATYLPKEQGKSYREATNQMHARLYGDLRELKRIKD